MKNVCVSACGRLTSGRLRIVSEGWAGSSENTTKLYTINGLTQAGYATHMPTVLVGAESDYQDLLFLSIPYLPSYFPLYPYFYVKRSDIC